MSSGNGNGPASPVEETVGQRLRRLRLAAGLSQRELAEPGVSYAYISRIEAGTRSPSVKALRKLAKGLGVTAAYLETGTERTETDRVLAELGEKVGPLRISSGAGVMAGDPPMEVRVVIEARIDDAVAVFAGASLSDALFELRELVEARERLAAEKARLEQELARVHEAAATLGTRPSAGNT